MSHADELAAARALGEYDRERADNLAEENRKLSSFADEVERLREANEHLRTRVGELESLRVEWRTAARQQSERADGAGSSALREVAAEIASATIERLNGYGTEHAETARVTIEGCLAVLRRRVDELDA